MRISDWSSDVCSSDLAIRCCEVCSILRATASLFMQCLHHKQVPSLCCVVCLPLSHGFARNQGQGNSTVPDIVSLLAEYIHNLLLQFGRVLAALWVCGCTHSAAAVSLCCRDRKSTRLNSSH